MNRYRPDRRWLSRVLRLLVLLVPLTASAIPLRAFASDPAADAPAEIPPQTRAEPDLRPKLNWETGQGKSYSTPAWEIPAFLLLLNGFDRLAYPNEREDGKRTYSSNLSTTWEHLRRQNWTFDKDPFKINQFLHPYQGATMYGLARSTGLGFWESWAYANAGEFVWKMAGETGDPSINDMVTTGTAGTLLGEALFRIGELILEDGGQHPGWVRETGAAVALPPLAFNRFAFGNRFKSTFPSHKPATYWHLRAGETIHSRIHGAGSLFGEVRQSTGVEFEMSYGLPGKPGYTYRRPLDYFDLRIMALGEAGNPIEDVMLRGLLFGREYQAGDEYRGVWGLYGSYDYFSPYEFRVSSTALQLGSTGQLWISPTVAMQGSILGGVGFGAAGHTPVATGERDYHYGFTPQGLLDLRFLFADRAMITATVREYYVSGAGTDPEGSERLFRGTAGATVRIFRRHGIGFEYTVSIRNAHYENRPRLEQTQGTLSIFYTYLGNTRFGAVDWR